MKTFSKLEERDVKARPLGVKGLERVVLGAVCYIEVVHVAYAGSGCGLKGGVEVFVVGGCADYVVGGH